jgi:hypothetical protein
MNEGKQREKWTQDVRDRQRNVVFPQTLANETRLWRHILDGKTTPLTWVGLAVLGIFVFGFMVGFLKILSDAGGLWQGAIETVLIVGPIFGLIVWATRHNLRSLERSRHKSRAGKL